MSYTSDDLLKSVKRGISIPNFQALLSDQDILELADEETQSLILPILLSTRQEYFVVLDQITIVPGQVEYSIPYRAVGRGLRNLLYTVDTVSRKMAEIAPEDACYYTNNGTSGTPYGFYFRGDKIVIVPSSEDTSAFLTVTYHMRPNKLVPVAQAGLIAAIDTILNTVTVNVLPPGLTTNTICDFIQGKQGCQTIDFDLTVTSVSGNVVSFAALPTGIVKGDYLCLAEQSPVLQIPQEGLQVLAQAVQLRVLEAIEDTEGLQNAKERLTEKIRQFKDLIIPRIEGIQQKVVNRTGLLRRGNYLRSNRRYVG